jgi:thermitase
MSLKRFFLLLVIALLLAGSLPALQVRAEADPALEYAPGEVIVGLADGFTVKALSLPSGVKVLSTSEELEELDLSILSVPVGEELATAKKLALASEVLFAEPNYQVDAFLDPTSEPRWPDQYGPQRVHAPQGWDLTTGSPDVIIAIVDSGIDASHPEFDGRLLPGWDYVEMDGTPQDECGHGTHVTGIAAASGDNSQGIAGMDWYASILPVRVLARNCSGYISDVASGIVYAVEQGADVINLSLGLGGPSRVLEYATYYAYQHGVAVFAAAGNSGSAFTVYPAGYPWVMAVGATNASDGRASFSNTGAFLDIMAPGETVLSTSPLESGYDYETSHALTTGYGYLSGTSMAAPHASGAAGLLLASDHASGTTKFNSPDKIYNAFTSTALDLDAAGRDNNTGYGLLQVDLALASNPAGGLPRPTRTVEYDALSSSRCENFNFSWLDASGGTVLGAISGNNSTASTTLPFDFNLGGTDYPAGSTLRINSNGYMMFDLGPGDDNNAIIPLALPTSSNAFLAPYWDDLTLFSNPDHDDERVFVQTMGTAPNRMLVIEWYRLQQKLDANSDLIFEVVLYERILAGEPSNRILFQYQRMTGQYASGDSATIGIEYNSGYDGVMVAYNHPGAVAASQAIVFIPVAGGATRSPLSCLSATEINPTGGTYPALPDPFCLQIPNGLVPADTTLRISGFERFTPLLSGFNSLGHFADISLDPEPPTPFNPQPYVCYQYTAADVVASGGRPQNMFIAAYDEILGTWERLVTTADTAQQRLYAPVSHFSVFGVYAPRQPEELPVTGAAQQLGFIEGLLLAMVLVVLLSLGLYLWKRTHSLRR